MHKDRRLIWTHCDTDDGVPGGGVEVSWCPGDVVIVKQGRHMRQGGEGDIGHAVALLDVNDHFRDLVAEIKSFESVNRSNFMLFVTLG